MVIDESKIDTGRVNIEIQSQEESQTYPIPDPQIYEQIYDQLTLTNIDHQESDISLFSPPNPAFTPPPPHTPPPNHQNHKKTYATKRLNLPAGGPISHNSKDKQFYVLNSMFCCCVTKYIGNMPVLVESRDGSPKLIVGAWWPFCMFFTVPLIIIPSTLVTIFLVIPYAPVWMLILYPVFIFCTLASLACVSCKNPGLVEHTESNKTEGAKNWIWNDRVKSFRPRGAIYCDNNNVVIEDYDHFCPWTGTAVGKNNMKFFKIFVVCINTLCYVTIFLIILLLVLRTRNNL